MRIVLLRERKKVRNRWPQYIYRCTIISPAHEKCVNWDSCIAKPRIYIICKRNETKKSHTNEPIGMFATHSKLNKCFFFKADDFPNDLYDLGCAGPMHMVRVHVVHTSIIIVVVDVVVVVVAAHTLHTSMQSAIYAHNQVLAIYFRVVYRCWLFYGRIFFFSLISSYTIFRRIYVYMHHTSHFFSVLCVGNFYFRHLLVLKCIHFCGTARCAQHDWVRAANASASARAFTHC